LHFAQVVIRVVNFPKLCLLGQKPWHGGKSPADYLTILLGWISAMSNLRLQKGHSEFFLAIPPAHSRQRKCWLRQTFISLRAILVYLRVQMGQLPYYSIHWDYIIEVV
jgi:hypothetical protein